MYARRLSHVFWVGGSPCAGKSTVVDYLASIYEVQVYRCDDFFGQHIRMAKPDKQPTLHSITRMTWDDIWMRPVEQQLAEEIRAYEEQFDFIVQDLLAMPRTPPIIAEGAALLPERVLSLLHYHWQAIWFVPAAEFQYAHYPQRGEWVQDILAQCSAPEQAFANWMARDKEYADRVYMLATENDLPVIEVDGAYSVEQYAELVESQFRWNMPPPDAWVEEETSG